MTQLHEPDRAGEPPGEDLPAAPLIEFRDISKRFDATQALDRVSLSVLPGTVHALLGQNGAGKSTLIKILARVYEQDSGEIVLRHDLREAKAPVSFIHQDLGLIPSATVAENVALVRGFPRRGGHRGVISWRGVEKQAREVLAMTGSQIPVDVEVQSLSRADQSIVAIARALAMDSRVLVLDEPTASLPEHDIEHPFDVLHQLKAKGVGIIYVTHRLDEIPRVADVVSVLRDGRLIATSDAHTVSVDDLIEQIVGRNVSRSRTAAPAAGPADQGIQIQDVLFAGGRDRVSVAFGAGEIVGAAGLRGAGQEEFGRVLAGVDRALSGSVTIDGQRLENGSLQSAWRVGIGFVTSRRQEEGIAPTLTVRENVLMNPGALGRHSLRPGRIAAERQVAGDLGERFSIRPNEPEMYAGALSGGNQQKVLLARVITVTRRLLILEEPTMGVDVGARADVYAILREAAAAGLTVLVVSSDLEELVQISHRILVFNKGRFAADVPHERISIENLTRLVGGDELAKAS